MFQTLSRKNRQHQTWLSVCHPALPDLNFFHNFMVYFRNRVWWCTPVVQALGRLR
jgi:hypothetical protein